MKEKVVERYHDDREYTGFKDVMGNAHNWMEDVAVPLAIIGGLIELPFSVTIATTVAFVNGIRKLIPPKKKKEFTFVDGKKEGEYRSWHENGRPHIRASYHKGLLNGPYEEYYENGRLAEKCTYVDGRKEGPFIIFYKSGQLTAEGTYKDGEPEGHFKGYHENGQLKLEVIMKHGEFDGMLKAYHPNGQIQGIGFFKEGKNDGPAKEYNEDGDLIKDEVYRNGTLLKGQEADDYMEEWNKQQLEKDPTWLEVTEKLEHLTDDVYYRPIKPARTPERTEKAKKLMKVRRGAELLASAMKDAEVNKKNTLLTALRKLAHPFAEEEMLQRRVFSRLRTSRRIRRKQKEL